MSRTTYTIGGVSDPRDSGPLPPAGYNPNSIDSDHVGGGPRPVPARYKGGYTEEKAVFFRQNWQHSPVRLGVVNNATERLVADHNRTAGTPLRAHEVMTLQARVNSAWLPAEKVRTDHPAVPTSANPRHAGRFVNIF